MWINMMFSYLWLVVRLCFWFGAGKKVDRPLKCSRSRELIGFKEKLRKEMTEVWLGAVGKFERRESDTEKWMSREVMRKMANSYCRRISTGSKFDWAELFSTRWLISHWTFQMGHTWIFLCTSRTPTYIYGQFDFLSLCLCVMIILYFFYRLGVQNAYFFNWSGTCTFIGSCAFVGSWRRARGWPVLT